MWCRVEFGEAPFVIATRNELDNARWCAIGPERGVAIACTSAGGGGLKGQLLHASSLAAYDETPA